MIGTAADPVTLVEAIGDLWLLALVLVIGACLFLFRNGFRDLLKRVNRVRGKWGNKEISLEEAPVPEESPLSAIEQAPPEENEESKAVDKNVDEKPEEHPFTRMILAFVDKRFSDAEDALNDLQQSESDEIEKIENRSTYLEYRYTFANDPSAIPELDRLAEEKPEARASVLSSLARCYRYADDYPKAEEKYQAAINARSSADEQVHDAVELAKCKQKHGAIGEGIELLAQMLLEVCTDEARVALYQGIASLERDRGANDLNALALEKVVEYRPDDADIRFSAAYALSRVNLAPAAILNYRMALKFKPEHGMALNNLGVLYGRSDLPIKAISAYRRGVEAGQTLAMSNLGFHFLKGGFLDEAESLVNDAKNIEGMHPNVGKLITRVSEKRKSEDEKRDHLLELADQQQQFLRQFAEAHFLPTDGTDPFEGTWINSTGECLKFTQNNDEIGGSWGTDETKYTVTGTRTNRGARLTLRTGHSTTLLTSSSPTQGLAFVKRDKAELQMMTFEKDKVEFFSFSKRQAES